MRPQPNAPTPLTLARAALLALVASTVLVLSTARATRADGCKPDGERCATDVSCCSRTCMKPAPPPGKAKPLFGVCGTATTTTSSSTTTTTTALPPCDPSKTAVNCTCSGGTPRTFACTPNPCAGLQAEAAAQCGSLFGEGPGDCATKPCIDCTTGGECQ